LAARRGGRAGLADGRSPALITSSSETVTRHNMVLTDATDLFVLEEEPLVDLEDEFGSSFFILFRNFALNTSGLRPSHQHVLSERVLGFVNRSVGFAELYAMTDRSGSRTVNFRVSAGRLTAVQRHLLGLGAPLTKVMHPFAKAIGEDFFKDRF